MTLKCKESGTYPCTGIFQTFVSEESGQGMVEYGLILGLIILAVVGTLLCVGNSIFNIFDSNIMPDVGNALI